MRGTAAALLLAAALSPGCGGTGAKEPAPALVVVPSGSGAPPGSSPVAFAEVASTPESRERGLMFRDVLAPDTGMLFVYPEERVLGFWMKNCRTPLSAAFLDSAGRVLNLVEMAPGAGIPDGDLPRHESAGPARFVLEMESGWFTRRGIRPGDRVDLAPALRGVVAR